MKGHTKKEEKYKSLTALYTSAALERYYDAMNSRLEHSHSSVCKVETIDVEQGNGLRLRQSAK